MDPVLAVLAERRRAGSRPGGRTDGHRVVLGIEGGGMRGTVAAGMAEALWRAGLLPAFDAVYGSSAGSVTGAWLVSSQPERLRGWVDPRWAIQLIRGRNLVRRRPYIYLEGLIDQVYVHHFPMDFASVLASPVPLHPMATDARTGLAVDLRPLIHDEVELRTALRASCTLPIAAGRPVRLGDGLYCDAGLAESVPFAKAVSDGATHVMVLRTRYRSYESDPDPVGWRRTFMERSLWLTGHQPAVAESLGSRARRAALDRAVLEEGRMVTPRGEAFVSTVWPAEGSATAGRTERDGRVLEAAYDGGIASFDAAVTDLIGGGPAAGADGGRVGPTQTA